MSLLLILLIVQITGIILSAIGSCYENLHERNKVYISENLTCSTRAIEGEWPWLTDYFQSYPDSSLKDTFPESYKIAMAIKHYKEINRLQESGLLSVKQYDKKLDKLLSNIDVNTAIQLL